MINMKNNEQGIVSILVSIVMMIVLTLLVLGLAQIGVSDQKNALKRQLSTAAYYLAESGINNALNGGVLADNSTCSNTILDSSINASIPCVIIKKSGLDTSFYQLTNGQSKVIPIVNNLTGSGQPNGIGALNFTWSTTKGISSDCNSYVVGNAKLSSVVNWGQCPPLLMISFVSDDLITPKNGATTLPTSDLFKEGLASGIVTAYLYPTKSSSYSSGSLSDINSIVPVTCSDVSGSATCTLKLNFTNMKLSNKYYMRVTPFYGSTALTFQAFDRSSTQNVLNSLQASVDSTGKVGTTSQRLYSRITTDTISNLANQGFSDQTPLFAIQTTNDLCKNFQGYYNSPSDNVFNVDSKTGSGSTAACQ